MLSLVITGSLASLSHAHHSPTSFVHSEHHTSVLLIQYNQARRNRKGACRGDSSADVHFCMLYRFLQYGDRDNSLGTILGMIASATYRGEQVVVRLYQLILFITR